MKIDMRDDGHTQNCVNEERSFVALTAVRKISDWMAKITVSMYDCVDSAKRLMVSSQCSARIVLFRLVNSMDGLHAFHPLRIVNQCLQLFESPGNRGLNLALI